jgi:hypothetical protein
MRSDEECPLVKGQYKIRSEDGKRYDLYMRVTNSITCLGDRFLIERKNERDVAIGLAQTPGLYALAVAAHPDDRDAYNEICKKAKTAAKGSDKADQGTAKHTLTERVDRGEDPDAFPEPFRSDLLAYKQTLDAAGIEILEIEKYVVLPDLKVAGRFDRLVSFGSKPMIADLKTGSLDFGLGEMAAQLATYSRGKTIYDPKTETHRPMPEVDQDTGIIIHLPVGKGVCTLWFLDLQAGWEAAGHAAWIRQWRKRKDLADPWRPGTRLDSLIERRAGIVTRLETLKACCPQGYDELRHQWPAGIPTLKQSQAHGPDQLSAIDTVLCAIEDRYGAPFGPVDPNHNATLKGAT